MTKKPRRRLFLKIALAIAAVLAIAAAVGSFVVFRRLSTRGPGEVASGKAAEFALPDHLGETTTLAGLLEHGPAVLVFYRGHW